ncbi:hypothetical protein Dimus_023945, partial [Dionaea muscipula]
LKIRYCDGASSQEKVRKRWLLVRRKEPAIHVGCSRGDGARAHCCMREEKMKESLLSMRPLAVVSVRGVAACCTMLMMRVLARRGAAACQAGCHCSLSGVPLLAAFGCPHGGAVARDLSSCSLLMTKSSLEQCMGLKLCSCPHVHGDATQLVAWPDAQCGGLFMLHGSCMIGQ